MYAIKSKMKNILNAEPYPDTLNLKGLVVDGNISAGNVSAGTIQTISISSSGSSTLGNLEVINLLTTNVLAATTIFADTLTSPTINSTTVTATNVNSNNANIPLITTQAINLPTLGSINFGINPFTYRRGTWNPVPRTLRLLGLGPTLEVRDWSTAGGPVVNSLLNGYFVKCGFQVTVFFETETNFWGSGNDSLTYRTPIIQGLPFKCISEGTPINVRMSGVMDDVDFPNGYAGGIAAPLAVVMDGSFVATIPEEGFLFTTRTPPFYVNQGQWVADGYTITISCAQSQFTLLGGVAWSGLEGTLYNANVLALSQYTARFTGSVTYFTDE